MGTERPILIVGDLVFHGQHQQLIGTAMVVADVAHVAAAGAPAAAVSPAAVTLTSRRIIFKLASGRVDVFLARIGSTGPSRPSKKAKT